MKNNSDIFQDKQKTLGKNPAHPNGSTTLINLILHQEIYEEN